jgi:hypothetical protein
VSVCPVRVLAFGVRIHLGIDTPLTFLVLAELEISVVSFSHDEDCAGINEPATEVAKAERAVEIDSAVEVATSEPATGAEKEYMSESFTRESGVKKRKTYRAGKKTREKKEVAAARKAALELKDEAEEDGTLLGGWQQAGGKRIQRKSRLSNDHVVEKMNGSAEPEIAPSGIETPTYSLNGATGNDTQDDDGDMRTKREPSDDSTAVDESAPASSETSLSDEEPRIGKEFGDDSLAEDESLQHPTSPSLDILSNSPTKIEPRSQDQDDLPVIKLSTATSEASLAVQVIPPTRQVPRIKPVTPLPRKPSPVAQTIPSTVNTSPAVQSPPTTSNASPSTVAQTKTQEEHQTVYVAKKEELIKSITPVPLVVVVPPQVEQPRRAQELNEADWPHLDVKSSLPKTSTSKASPMVQSNPATIITSPVPSAVVIPPQVEPPKSTQELDEVEQPVVSAESPPTTIKFSPLPLAVVVPSQVEPLRSIEELDEVEWPRLGI